jgi:hypothetical protein
MAFLAAFSTPTVALYVTENALGPPQISSEFPEQAIVHWVEATDGALFEQ